MNKIRKALSFVLSAVMLLSCVVFSAFAETKTSVTNDGVSDVHYATENGQDTLEQMKKNKQVGDEGVALYVPKTNYYFMRTSETDTFTFVPRIYMQLAVRTWKEWIEHVGFLKKTDMTLNDVSFAFASDTEDGGKAGSNPSYPTTYGNNKRGYLMGFDGYYGSMKGLNKGSADGFTAPEGYEVCTPTQNGQADFQLDSSFWTGSYIMSYDMTVNFSANIPADKTKWNGDLKMDLAWAGTQQKAYSLKNKIQFDLEIVDLVPLNKLLAEAKKMNDQKPAHLNQAAEDAFAAMQNYVQNTIYANCGTKNEYTGLLNGDKYLEDSVVNGDGGYVKTLETLIATAKKEMMDSILVFTNTVIEDKSISDYRKLNSNISQTYQSAFSKYNGKDLSFYKGLSDEIKFDTLLSDYNNLEATLEKNGYDFPNVAVYKRQVRFEKDGMGGLKPEFKFRIITAISKTDFDRIIQETSNIVEVGFIAAPSAKVNAEGYENARKFVESGGTVGALGDFKHGTTKTVYINAEKPESYMHFGCMMQGLIKGETITDDLKTSAYVKYKRAYIENGQAKIDNCYVWYDTFNEAPVFSNYETIKQAWIAKYGV